MSIDGPSCQHSLYVTWGYYIIPKRNKLIEGTIFRCSKCRNCFEMTPERWEKYSKDNYASNS